MLSVTVVYSLFLYTIQCYENKPNPFVEYAHTKTLIHLEWKSVLEINFWKQIMFSITVYLNNELHCEYKFFCHDATKNEKLKLTTFSGNFCPGKYFTFSWVSLMISVNFLPLMISSYTYMVTRSSKLGKLLALAPTIFAIADPL